MTDRELDLKFTELKLNIATVVVGINERFDAVLNLLTSLHKDVETLKVDVAELWAEVRAIHELVQIPESQAREGRDYVQ